MTAPVGARAVTTARLVIGILFLVAAVVLGVIVMVTTPDTHTRYYEGGGVIAVALAVAVFIL